MPAPFNNQHKIIKPATPVNNIITIHGFIGCGFFDNAVKAAKQYKKMYPNSTIQINPVPRTMWEGVIKTYALAKGLMHKTSPLIFYNSKYVGGYDAFITQLKKSVPFS